MNISSTIGILYFIISALFAYNFSVIFQKIKDGSAKVNRYSLFATSSLVITFFAEALNHFGLGLEWVLIAQTYLLWTMLYIVYSKRNDKQEEKV
jgi:hypothetical protein